MTNPSAQIRPATVPAEQNGCGKIDGHFHTPNGQTDFQSIANPKRDAEESEILASGKRHHPVPLIVLIFANSKVILILATIRILARIFATRTGGRTADIVISLTPDGRPSTTHRTNVKNSKVPISPQFTPMTSAGLLHRRIEGINGSDCGEVGTEDLAPGQMVHHLTTHHGRQVSPTMADLPELRRTAW